MDGSAEDYLEMFSHPNGMAKHIDFRKNGELVGVSIVDVLPDGLSSVYFYFSPKYLHLSLGTFSALVEIQECLERHLSTWYIGYIVEQCPKMSYKAQFQPQERLVDDTWVSMNNSELNKQL